MTSTSISHGSYTCRTPLYTDDNKLWIGAAGKDIHVVSTTTGKILRVLSGHSAAVTGLTFRHNNHHQLISSSLDRSIRVWDFDNGLCVQHFLTPRPILRLASVEGGVVVAAATQGSPMVGFGMEGAYIASQHPTTSLKPAAAGADDGAGDDSAGAGAAVGAAVGAAASDSSKKPKAKSKADREWDVRRYALPSALPGAGKTSSPDTNGVAGTGAGAGSGASASDSDDSDVEVDVDVPPSKLAAKRASKVISLTPSSPIFKSQPDVCLGLVSHDRWVIALSKNRLLLWDSASRESYAHKHIRAMTCLGVSPAEKCVVTGDVSGMLVFWHCLNTPEESHPTAPVTTTRHWHSSAPSCLAFTSDGSYMISGGEEGVLVIWQLATDKTTFLPRLGAPIRTVAVSGNSAAASGAHPLSYSVGLSCNVVLSFEAASLKETWRLRGLGLAGNDALTHRSLMGPLVCEPRSGAAVFNSGTGTLQLVDPNSGTHISEIDVIGRNPVQRVKNIRHTLVPGATAPTEAPPEIAITHAIFSPDGSYLLTSEKCGDSCSLKFWNSTRSLSSFSLNTQVDEPHKSPVTILLHHPLRHLVLTASGDRTFKMWDLVDAVETSPDDVSAGAVWHCRSVGSYRDLPITAAAFSSDGSVLAIAAGHVITLWDPATNTMLTSLCHLPPSSPVLHLGFAGSSPFLVAATSRELLVWDLLSNKISWSIKARVNSLATTTLSPFFAVGTKAVSEKDKGKGKEKGKGKGKGKGKEKEKGRWKNGTKKSLRREEDTELSEKGIVTSSVFMFDPSGPTPVCKWISKNPTTLAFVRLPGGGAIRGQPLPLAMLDWSHNLHVLQYTVDSSAAATPAVEKTPVVAAAAAPEPISGYTAMFGDEAPLKRARAASKAEGEDAPAVVGTDVRSRAAPLVGDVPSHAFTSVSALAAALMPRLLPPRVPNKFSAKSSADTTPDTSGLIGVGGDEKTVADEANPVAVPTKAEPIAMSSGDAVVASFTDFFATNFLN